MPKQDSIYQHRIAQDSYPSWNHFPLKSLLFMALIMGLGWQAIHVYYEHQHKGNSTKATEATQINLPEDSERQGAQLWYRCPARRSIHTISKTFLDYSEHFSSTAFKSDLKAINPGAFQGDTCPAGSRIQIPRPLWQPIQNQSLAWALDRPIKAIYMRGDNARPNRITRELNEMKKHGVNGLVFDVKDILGVVNYRSEVPQVEELRRHRAPIQNLTKLIHYLHQNEIYVIARMALFQDANLAQSRPAVAIKDGNSPTGTLRVKGKPLWVDPGQPFVRDYNLAIVDELIAQGVDEIQFDYVRYPAEGDLSRVSYHNVQSPADKTAHLVEFLSAAWLKTRLTGVRTSIDIFGIVAWGEEVDIQATGQRIEKLAPWVDVISPMLYPSHFSRGFEGFENPADEGLHFYQQGVKKVLARANVNPHLVVRPWVQAFKWRVSNFNEEYIADQIRGSYLGGGLGWLMWNAGNRYELVYSALRDGHPEGTTDTRQTGRLTLGEDVK